MNAKENTDFIDYCSSLSWVINLELLQLCHGGGQSLFFLEL